MILLRTEKGKFFVGSLEVKAEPIYAGLEVDVGFQQGKLPSLERVLADVVSDAYKNKVDLFSANAYRLFILGQVETPETKVMDGVVPGEVKRKIVFDFYKAYPVKPISEAASK